MDARLQAPPFDPAAISGLSPKLRHELYGGIGGIDGWQAAAPPLVAKPAG